MKSMSGNSTGIKYHIRLFLFCVGFVFSSALSVDAQDGSMDASFNTIDQGIHQNSYGCNGNVLAIAIQTDGKILIGGVFTTYNGLSAPYIARLNANGLIDGSFNSISAGIGSEVRKILVQPDGKILVGGLFGIRRLLASGNPDIGFNSGGSGADGAVNDILYQSGGNVIIGGAFINYNGVAASYLIRLTANGSRDLTFNSGNIGPDGEIKAIAIQSSNRLMVAGNLTRYNTTSVNYIAKISTNGSYDVTFSNSGNQVEAPINTIAVQADGKCLVGDEYNVFRLNSNGSMDGTFSTAAANAGIGERINKIIIQADQKILLAFGNTEYQNNTYFGGYGRHIVRRNTNGSEDLSFKYEKPLVKEIVFNMAVQADGKILIGHFLSARAYRDPVPGFVIKGYRNYQISRLGADGKEDLSFNVNPLEKGANRPVYAIAAQSDGKILLGGSFDYYNGQPANYLLRLNADGTKDPSFSFNGSGPNNMVNDIVLQSDGKILVGGNFRKFNGDTVGSLIRLLPNGNIDNSFYKQSLNGAPVDFVKKITIQSDGKLLVGKLVTTQKALVRLLANGQEDPTFNAAINTADPYRYIKPSINTLSVFPDQKILAGGFFNRVNGLPYSEHLVRLNEDGSTDLTFLPNTANSYAQLGTDQEVFASSILKDGKILIGGAFERYSTLFKSTSVSGICRLNIDSELDTSFNLGGSGFNKPVYAISLQADGKILIAGTFTSYNGLAAHHLIRLNPDGTSDNSFNAGASGADSSIYALEILPGENKILVGGEFRSYNNQGKNHLAKITNCAVVPAVTKQTICSGLMPFVWNGNSYDSAATYSVNFPTTSGCDSTAILVLTVAPNGAGIIEGPVRVCRYVGATGDTASYSIGAAPGSTITWSVSNTGTMLIVGGQGTGTAKLKFTDAFTSGSVYARVSNSACGSAVRRSLAVNRSLPSTPGTIVASNSDICPILDSSNYGNYIPISYTIKKVASANSYIWTSQLGSTILRHPNGPGVNDTIVQLYFTDQYSFSTSTITVQAVNDCGAGGIRSLTITRAVPATPSVITGPVNVCGNLLSGGAIATYSVTAVSGFNYNWNLPDGVLNVTGQNTANVSFQYPDNFVTGTIGVYASNGCGSSSTRNLSVKIYKVSTPGTITTLSSGVCPNRQYTYSISSYPANATSLIWSVPTGGIILNGQGTTSITVSYSAAAISGFVSVQSFNACSNSSIRKITISLAACSVPFIAGINDNNASDGKGYNKDVRDDQWAIQLFPNPSPSGFKVMVNSSSQAIIYYRVLDASGKILKQFTGFPGQEKRWGDDLIAGMYFLEVLQGSKKMIQKAVKL